MAELKTKVNDLSVTEFLDGVTDTIRRQDCYTILNLMEEVTGYEPKMWGDSIVGFGSYHYRYASGREGDMPLTGFSPRKQNLTIYIMSGFEHYELLMAKLGKFKTGKTCLYINTVADIDLLVLRELVTESVRQINRTQRRLIQLPPGN